MRGILVVVDMQNDFIDGSLGTREAKKIVPAVVSRIKERKEQGYEIVFTMDTHNKDYLSTQEGINLPVEHCIKGTYGWRLNALVAPEAENAKIFEKPTFGSTELFLYLAEKKPEIVEVVGLCTDICVVSNALGIKAFLPEAEVRVAAECCAGVSVESHNAAIETMKSCQIKII